MKRTRTMVIAMLSMVIGACVGDLEGIGGDDEDDLLIEGKTSAPITIIQHNIYKLRPVLDLVLAHAQAVDAHGITLQEVCPVDAAWLVSTYGDKWSIAVGPGKHPGYSGCDLPNGTRDIPSNVVIWRKGTGGNRSYFPHLAGPTGTPGHMVCLKVERANVPVHLCSAHLVSADWTDPSTGIKYNGEELRAKQTAFIKQLARDEWFGGNKNHFGIVGGDFNGKPNTPPLDKMYDGALGGTGDFVDYNRTPGTRNGEVTAVADGDNTEDGQPYSKQIDYIFFSTNRAPINGDKATVRDDASDHHMVTATVQMKK
jgi:hypothetical protein